MENENIQELKTPFQALKLLKQDMNNHSKFNELVNKGFLNKDRFFDLAYELIKDNFKQTKKVFILQAQIDIIMMNEVQLNINSAMNKLIENDLLYMSGVNPEGELVYKLTDAGINAVKFLTSEDGKKETN
jgi:hypothetical protein